MRSIAPFGVFVDLGGIDGLVHKSELSWNKVNNPESGYHVGEEVEAEVIDINHERGRISLSIRRLHVAGAGREGLAAGMVAGGRQLPIKVSDRPRSTFWPTRM